MARAARKVWVDPRMLIGLLLVLGSVLGVTWLVAAADRSTSVYSAGQLLMPGDRIEPDQLRLSQVHFGDTSTAYLGIGDIPEEGLVVTRVVGAGELIPAAAVADAATSERTPVVLSLYTELPSSVQAGSVVELWAAAPSEYDRYSAPELIAADVLLVRSLAEQGFVTSDAAQVEVLVPRASLPRVLAAAANGDAISLVTAQDAADADDGSHHSGSAEGESNAPGGDPGQLGGGGAGRVDTGEKDAEVNPEGDSSTGSTETSGGD